MEKSNKIPKQEVVKNEKKDTLIVSVKDSTRVKSLDDLVTSCDVDLETWEVDWFDVGTYEVTGFDEKRRPVTITMYRTKAKFKKIDVWKNIPKLTKDLKQDLFETFQSYGFKPTYKIHNKSGE